MKRLFDLNSILSLCFVGFFLTSFIQFSAFLLGYNSPSNFLISSINSYQVYLPQKIEGNLFFRAMLLQLIQYFTIYLAFKYLVNQKIRFYLNKIKILITPIFLRKLYFLTIFFSFLLAINMFLKINYILNYLFVIIKFLITIYFFLIFNKFKFKKIYFYILIIGFIVLQFIQFESNFGRGSVLSFLFALLIIYIHSDSKFSAFKLVFFISIAFISAVYLTALKFSPDADVFYFAIDQIFSRLNFSQSNYWVLESPQLFENYDDSLNRLTNFIIPFVDFVSINNGYNLNQYAFQLAYGGSLASVLDVSGGYAFTPIAESLINFKSISLSVLFIFVYYLISASFVRFLLKISPLVIFSLIYYFIVGILFPENLIYITQSLFRDSLVILILCLCFFGNKSKTMKTSYNVK